jgi:quercetin dioxygenase-like cupin family protein
MRLPILQACDSNTVRLGLVTLHVLCSPSRHNSGYMRMTLLAGDPGGHIAPQSRFGNEAIYIERGELELRISGRVFRVGAGQAIMVAPDAVCEGLIVGNQPLVGICFCCDECSVLANFRAAGVPGPELPRVVSEKDVTAEQLGELSRAFLLTPSRDGVNFLRLGIVSGFGGARGQVHTHLGNECFFTLAGEGSLLIGGENHVVGARHGICIPPDTEHPLTVTGESWKAVAAYCDDCPILKRARAVA